MAEKLNPAASARKLLQISSLQPRLGIILGSGFHHVLTRVETVAQIAYKDIPGFPKPSVKGHAGKVILGRAGGVDVIVLSGRAHFYEGNPMSLVTFPTRTLAEFGVTDLLLTNAAGGVNKKFKPGDFMVLTDHINLMAANPLVGAEIDGLPRFVDCTAVYDSQLSSLLAKSASALKIKIRKGVYLAVSGPSYETPAEVRAFARLGADAVGMSTVPEAIVARQCGIRVAGLSCITNLAAGCGGETLSHTEVLETAERVKTVAADFLETFVRMYGKHKPTS